MKGSEYVAKFLKAVGADNVFLVHYMVLAAIEKQMELEIVEIMYRRKIAINCLEYSIQHNHVRIHVEL
jgi:NADH:ubiquinone oxidoreductase subunit K